MAEKFIIGGHEFTLPREKGRVFQNDIRNFLHKLFENNLLPKDELEKLCTKQYSQEMLGLKLPLFVRNEGDTRDRTDHLRYWVKPIHGYYACKEWWLQHFSEYNESIRSKWIPHLQRLNDVGQGLKN